MLQKVNLDVGIGNGCSKPMGKNVVSLVFLQISHASMNILTKLCRHSNTKVRKQGVYKLSRA